MEGEISVKRRGWWPYAGIVDSVLSRRMVQPLENDCQTAGEASVSGYPCGGNHKVYPRSRAASKPINIQGEAHELGKLANRESSYTSPQLVPSHVVPAARRPCASPQVTGPQLNGDSKSEASTAEPTVIRILGTAVLLSTEGRQALRSVGVAHPIIRAQQLTLTINPTLEQVSLFLDCIVPLLMPAWAYLVVFFNAD